MRTVIRREIVDTRRIAASNARGKRSPGLVAVAGTIAALLALAPPVVRSARAEDPSLDQILERLRQLESDQKTMREKLDAKDAQIRQLQDEIDRMKAQQAGGAAPAATPVPATVQTPPPGQQTPPAGSMTAGAPSSPPLAQSDDAAPPPSAVARVLGRYAPGRGFTLIETPEGEVNFTAYTYLRYLNQKGLDKTYVNGFGQTVDLDRRNDIELNKVKLEFKGWFLDPAFRYVLYTWTNNTAQGQGAQVVVGGNISWVFSDAILLGGGIYPLPSVRSNEGGWPYFLGVDHRTLVDEFMRGSYTMGIFANGEPVKGLRYSVMLADNLSILGVDANQLDAKLQTVSAALWWMPTTGEYGTRGGFGDWDEHQKVATRIGAHFTFSPEDKQEQPNSEDPDNTQIRLSNGTNLFTKGALAPGVQVNDLHYLMTSFDTGMKYQGFSLEGEYYMRWLNHFGATGPVPESQLFDHGFQAMTSMMVIPQTVQLYAQGSYLFGNAGDPWELTGGLNWWILRRRELRFNLEYIYDRKSPVGYSAIPQLLGGTGSIVNANFEMYF